MCNRKKRETSMLSNATRFRRVIAGLCLILAPIFLLVSDLLETRDPTMSTDELLDSIAAHQATNEIAFAFAIYGFAFMVPAVIGIIHLLRNRSVILGHIGGTFAIIGLISFAFVGGTEFLLFGGGADPSLDRTTILALNDRIGQSVVYNLINMTEIFGFIFGLAILGAAIFRANFVPRIVGVLLTVGILTRLFLASFHAGVVISDVLYGSALVYLGYFVLKQTDAEWERPPERKILV